MPTPSVSTSGICTEGSFSHLYICFAGSRMRSRMPPSVWTPITHIFAQQLDRPRERVNPVAGPNCHGISLPANLRQLDFERTSRDVDVIGLRDELLVGIDSAEFSEWKLGEHRAPARRSMRCKLGADLGPDLERQRALDAAVGSADHLRNSALRPANRGE